MVISAWNWTVSLDSPDGSLNASIDDASEIGMGAPTRGELSISNGIVIPNCGPSIVWSDDSAFLAAPQWQPYDNGHYQRLLIVSIAHRSWQLLGSRYSVLELASFDHGVVRGTNSPAHNPTPIELDTASFCW